MTASKTQPALLGGVAIGVLSALPIINLGNCLCCLWVILGGALSAWLLQQGSSTRIATLDGGVVGLFAGSIGGVIAGLISFVVNLAFGPMQAAMIQRTIEQSDDLPPELRALLEGLQTDAMLGVTVIAFSLVFVLVCAVVGTIGGLFGALIFGKDPVPPTLDGRMGPPPFTPPPLPRGDA